MGAFALLVLAGAAELEALLPELLFTLPVVLVEGLLVVSGTLVVIAVTLVVDTGIEDVVVTTAVEDALVEVVVVADAEAREAENAEQRPNPTDAATASSDWLQADRRQGATADSRLGDKSVIVGFKS